LADDNSSNETHTPRDRQKPSWVSRCISQVKSYRHQRRTEKYHESATDRSARGTARATWAIAVLTLVTIGVGVSQYIIFSRQLDEMRATRESSDSAMAAQLKVMADQLNQMDIGQRPWVRLTKVIPLYLLVQETGIIIGLEYHAKNIGHSPAEGVYTTGKVFPELLLTDQNTAARAVCESSRAIFEDNPYGKNLEHLQSIVFPNEERQIKQVGGLIIRTDEIIQSKIRGIELQYKESIPYIGEEQAAAKRERELAELKTNPIFSAFYIVGCIIYAYRSGSALGKTAYVLDISRPCAESPVGKCAFEVSGHRDYEGGEMRVSEYNRDLLAE
jgi:hypothetical protein